MAQSDVLECHGCGAAAKGTEIGPDPEDEDIAAPCGEGWAGRGFYIRPQPGLVFARDSVAWILVTRVRAKCTA
jgi:hypothetical protein